MEEKSFFSVNPSMRITLQDATSTRNLKVEVYSQPFYNILATPGAPPAILWRIYATFNGK